MNKTLIAAFLAAMAASVDLAAHSRAQLHSPEDEDEDDTVYAQAVAVADFLFPRFDGDGDGAMTSGEFNAALGELYEPGEQTRAEWHSAYDTYGALYAANGYQSEMTYDDVVAAATQLFDEGRTLYRGYEEW